MKRIEKIHQSVLQLDGKPASFVTHALKNAGGGDSMQAGLLKITEIALQENRNSIATGRIQGALGALAFSVAAYCGVKHLAPLIQSHIARKADECNADPVVQAFEDEVKRVNEEVEFGTATQDSSADGENRQLQDEPDFKDRKEKTDMEVIL